MNLIGFFSRWRPETWRLAAICGFAFSLSVARFLYTGRRAYILLTWNLLLAILPWLASSLLKSRRIGHRGIRAGLFLVWLALFPNAPYLLTDLIHLFRERSAPVWYNLILLSSYALAGLLLACRSLSDLEDCLPGKPVIKRWAAVACLYLAAFGVYLGRFLRWNSWDLLVAPHYVVMDSLQVLAEADTAPAAWVFSLLLGTLLNLVYLWFRPSATGLHRRSLVPPPAGGGWLHQPLPRSAGTSVPLWNPRKHRRK